MQRVLSVHDTRVRSGAELLPFGLTIACSAQLVPFQRSARFEPVAVQAAAAVQETPVRSLKPDPLGFGVLWMVQPDPFQSSASVAELVAVEEPPTASHAVAEGHDTPLSALPVAPLTAGVLWMAQADPFQASARACVVPPIVNSPTASHDDAFLHETSLSWLAVAPDGSGVDWMDQVLPFHTSASVSMVAPLVKSPTAAQADADVH